MITIQVKCPKHNKVVVGGLETSYDEDIDKWELDTSEMTCPGDIEDRLNEDSVCIDEWQFEIELRNATRMVMIPYNE